MKIKSYFAPTVEDAMAMARQKLGQASRGRVSGLTPAGHRLRALPAAQTGMVCRVAYVCVRGV
jgi:hypothetical protein